MRFFGLDSSTTRIVTVYVDEEQKICAEFESSKKHGYKIGDIVNFFNYVDFNSIDFLAVGVGPGSLTGLRVGISFILGLGPDKKYLQINSLKLIGMNLRNFGKNIVVARKAREGYLYGAVYDEKMNTLREPFIESLEDFKKNLKQFEPYYTVGDGAQFLDNHIYLDLPTARNFYELAKIELENPKFVDFVEPMYLQKSIAELNFEKRQRGEQL